jgi:hypothetical protein
MPNVALSIAFWKFLCIQGKAFFKSINVATIAPDRWLCGVSELKTIEESLCIQKLFS